jgi:hypothetical protein
VSSSSSSGGKSELLARKRDKHMRFSVPGRPTGSATPDEPTAPERRFAGAAK